MISFKKNVGVTVRVIH